MKQRIRDYLNRFAAFQPQEVDQFYAALKPQTYPKKSFLLEQDQVCRYHFFILEGLVRFFYIDKKGNEQTVQFGIENWWITNMESFVQEVPSQMFIQALEPTSVLLLTKKDLERLYDQIPALERLFRKIAESTLIALQRRNAFYLKMSSEEKYNLVTTHLPDFLQRVPQYMVASYLGMTPEHLSAIRKKR